MINRNKKKKREYYRKCGICGGRFNQKDMVRDYGSSSDWICDDCFHNLHIEYDIEEW